MVKTILRIEGLAIFLASAYFYNLANGDWLLFIVLILVPDLAMLGYLKNKKFGTITYNIAHNYALGIAKIFLGLYLQNNFIISLGIILLAHVGIDRFFGLGLKYPTSFKNTHFHKV